MVYLDTSFIAPLVFAEASSEKVEAAIMAVKAGDLATSRWTQVELASLVARKLHMGELTSTEAAAVRGEMRKILEESFRVIVPSAADFDAARDYLDIPKAGLRAGDALHLAIAANHSARKIWSLDSGFIKAGKQFNLPVSAG